MVNTRKIKALMGANDHTRKYIAKLLNISNTALRNKLNNDVEFKASEIKSIADLYNLTIDELMIDAK